MTNEAKTIFSNLIALGLTYFIILLPINAIGTYLQIFASELGASPEIIGVILAIPYIFSMLSRFIGGYLADALGRKPVVTYTYLLGIVAYLIFVMANSWIYLIPFQILGGLGFLAQAAEASLMSESLPPDKRSTGMTLTQAPSALALILGPILASIVYAQTHDVIATCKLFGFILIIGYTISFIIRLILIKETKPPSENVGFKAFIKEYQSVFEFIFSNLKAPLFETFSLFVMFGFIAFTQLFAIKYLGIDPEVWGFLFALLAIFVAVGAVPGMLIGDNIGRVPSVKIATLLATIGFPIIAFSKRLSSSIDIQLTLFNITLDSLLIILVVAGILLAISFGMFYAVAGAYITELFTPDVRGKGVTVLMFFGDIGVVFGFLISGYVYANIDPRAIYLIATLIMLLAFLVSFKLPETLQKSKDKESKNERYQ